MFIEMNLYVAYQSQINYIKCENKTCKNVGWGDTAHRIPRSSQRVLKVKYKRHIFETWLYNKVNGLGKASTKKECVRSSFYFNALVSTICPIKSSSLIQQSNKLAWKRFTAYNSFMKALPMHWDVTALGRRVNWLLRASVGRCQTWRITFCHVNFTTTPTMLHNYSFVIYSWKLHVCSCLLKCCLSLDDWLHRFCTVYVIVEFIDSFKRAHHHYCAKHLNERLSWCKKKNNTIIYYCYLLQFYERFGCSFWHEIWIINSCDLCYTKNSHSQL